MKSSVLSSLVIALFAVSSSAAAIAVAPRAADNDFKFSCSNTDVNLQTDILTTTCVSESGKSITQTISLNTCIANANGQLVARFNGEFSASCPDTAFLETSLILEANCKNDEGDLVSTSIDLNQVFTNNNGIITCP